jgi:hypothetical protein
MGGTVAKVVSPITSMVAPKPKGPSAATTYAPTTAQVSQASATDMDDKGIRRRRRGRSMTILTGSAGVQEGATLGTPTLLG